MDLGFDFCVSPLDYHPPPTLWSEYALPTFVQTLNFLVLSFSGLRCQCTKAADGGEDETCGRTLGR